MKRAFGTLVAVILAVMGCQSYDAEPVSPNAIEVQDNSIPVVGHPLAPNIMIIVDKSGSMTDNAAGTVQGACDNAQGVYQPPGSSSVQDCKWWDLLTTLVGTGGGDAGFLAALDGAFATNAAAGDPLPLGLTELPGPSTAPPSSIAYACSASSASVLNQIQPDNTAAIEATLNAIVPNGGTPTAATITQVGMSFPPPDPTLMVQRSNYVILLTDGAPNCDSSFSPSATNCTGDLCTLGSCPASTYGMSTCACFDQSTNATIPEGCLDEDASVAAVAGLCGSGAACAGGIKTFVIGFGAVTTAPDAAKTLNEMGMAGGNTMDASGNYFFQANSASDLQAALTAILGQIATSKCSYPLEAPPPSQQLIEMTVTPSGTTNQCSGSGSFCGAGTCGNSNACTLAQSQFSFDMSSDTVTITDMNVCNAILESTPDDPVNVLIKYLHDE